MQRCDDNLNINWQFANALHKHNCLQHGSNNYQQINFTTNRKTLRQVHEHAVFYSVISLQHFSDSNNISPFSNILC